MKTYFFLIVVMMLMLSGCSQKTYNYRSTNIHTPNILAAQVFVDLDVDFTKNILTTSSFRKTLNEAKDEAYHKAIIEHNIDVVVDPIFEITQSGKKYQVKLTGIGAKYTNPRNKIEVIKELKSIDTTDIKKFNLIYDGVLVERKSKTIPLPVYPLNVPKNTNIFVDEKNTSIKSKLLFGVKASYGISNIEFYDGVEFQNENGILLGVLMETKNKGKIGFRMDMNYGQYGAISDLVFQYYLKFQLIDKLQLLGGTYFSTISENDFSDAQLNYGVSLGATYQISKRLFFEFSLNNPIKFSDPLPEDLLSKTTTFGISYKF